MELAQLSFNEIFDRVFISDHPASAEINKIKAGDHISLMNKKTFEHAFHVVCKSGPGYIETHRKIAQQAPENLHKFDGLTEIAGDSCTNPAAYENDEYAIVKTNQKNPRAEWNRAGLLSAFSEQHARKSHASMDKARVNSARSWK